MFFAGDAGDVNSIAGWMMPPADGMSTFTVPSVDSSPPSALAQLDVAPTVRSAKNASEDAFDVIVIKSPSFRIPTFNVDTSTRRHVNRSASRRRSARLIEDRTFISIRPAASHKGNALSTGDDVRAVSFGSGAQPYTLRSHRLRTATQGM
ncbi:hypothetical protein AKJ09_05812 [Labilithrix luteola]|uniref:Uncharacterized protein n=1 Tax=Labilithrix luteola TaxID=1391654 RepID=A0A0K1Q042_9BACT|nr:hypothetical protein AKJ09_05812 [Labilithrix luteola]